MNNNVRPFKSYHFIFYMTFVINLTTHLAVQASIKPCHLCDIVFVVRIYFVFPIESPVMKFTTAAFVNPFLYVRRTETVETVEIYEQFVLKTPTSDANLKVSVTNVPALTYCYIVTDSSASRKDFYQQYGIVSQYAYFVIHLI